ncbi:MAG: hypothetical protein M3347_03900 [Armatimonadota bacterium]|nr:hypothetical protein [Armatimonadota bacterium]
MAVESQANQPAQAQPPQSRALDRENRRIAALKLTEDGRPATLAELGDERRHLNKEERVKLEKHPFDVWQDIVERYSKEGFDSIDEDDMVRFKWYGIYQQRPKTGHFMLRLKVPGGAMNVAQLRTTAAMSRKHARGFADITTRQDFQVHWLTIETIPEVVEQLSKVGLTTLGACGDVARNVVSSPLAGSIPMRSSIRCHWWRKPRRCSPATATMPICHASTK